MRLVRTLTEWQHISREPGGQLRVVASGEQRQNGCQCLTGMLFVFVTHAACEKADRVAAHISFAAISFVA